MGKVELKSCSSCEWLYKGDNACPKCGSRGYNAYKIYGRQCYMYALSQKPWFDKKMAAYGAQLEGEIRNSHRPKSGKPDLEKNYAIRSTNRPYRSS